MRNWEQQLTNIKPLDEAWLFKAQARLDQQTRPQGSLGDLERVMAQLVAIQEEEKIRLNKKRIYIFAADHGVESEGVSAYPRSVTQAMVWNFLNGGATINALARNSGAEVKIVDVGVDGDFNNHPELVKQKIARGTRNFCFEEAMSEDEVHEAIGLGFQLAEQAVKEGIDLIALGEMGIANTTAASAVIGGCLNIRADLVTGKGTGLDGDGFKKKIQVIQKALDLHQPKIKRPLNVLRCVGGFEIAAMTGVILGCAVLRIPVVVDGVIVAASLLAASRMNRDVCDYVFFAHESEEKGHRLVLEALRAKPLLSLNMRLGEGSGAALALPLLQAGACIYNEVTTFEEAQVANRKQKKSEVL